jgi:hypothetical protein
VKEKELTRPRDALAAERRRMPRMAVEKQYRFEGPNGPASLLDDLEGEIERRLRNLAGRRCSGRPRLLRMPFYALREDPLPSDSGPREYRFRARSSRVATGTLACPRCDAPVAPARPLSPADRIACPFCTHAGAAREFLSLARPTRPARVVVRLYAAQRKPVASGRGASGLAGRSPGGSSSL